jgi:DNA-binding NarL/FixJ family response regulator
MKYKILIYDDDEVLRNSIASLLSLEADFEIIATKSNPFNVLKDIEIYTPDVVLMDIEMPVTTGIEGVQKIRTLHQLLPVIMLTVFEDADNIYQAICAGASGYLLKKTDPESIAAGIRDVLNGGAPMTSSIAKKVLQIMAPLPTTNTAITLENLSKREIELLTLMAKGNSYKMIAAALFISVETVRTHVKKIYKKLQVNNASGAVSKAINLKIVTA